MTLKLLSEHPSVLAKLRSEHEKFFTDSVERTAELLQADPSIIKQLCYTNAVVKESLRLLPVAMYAKDAPLGYDTASKS
jgi:cytochrome P450